MKMKNTMVVIAFAVTSSVTFASKMVVYNQIGYPVTVRVTYEPYGTTGEAVLKEVTVPYNDPKGTTFDTEGLTRFKTLCWWDEDNNKKVKYCGQIPSLPAMLRGAITLYHFGDYKINFDEKGASSSKEVRYNVDAEVVR